MSVWNKVREGIDKAGKAAQDVLDEGKTRIAAYRARELADKAAEALGYAVFRASETGKELDADSRERLMRSLRERDAEARKLEAELASESHASPNATAPTPPASPDAPAPPPPAADAGGPFTVPPTHV